MPQGGISLRTRFSSRFPHWRVWTKGRSRESRHASGTHLIFAGRRGAGAMARSAIAPVAKPTPARRKHQSGEAGRATVPAGHVPRAEEKRKAEMKNARLRRHFSESGRGRRTRTFGCWIQNPVPYQLGDTPTTSADVFNRREAAYYSTKFKCASVFARKLKPSV